MNAVLEAIYNKAINTTNSFKNSIGSRLYHMVAPQNPTFPFAIYFIVSDMYDSMFLEDYEDISVQFNIFSKSTTSYEAGTIFSNLISLYDLCNLSIAGYSQCHMNRVMSNLDYIPEENVWMYSVEYRIFIKKE